MRFTLKYSSSDYNKTCNNNEKKYRVITMCCSICLKFYFCIPPNKLSVMSNDVLKRQQLITSLSAWNLAHHNNNEDCCVLYAVQKKSLNGRRVSIKTHVGLGMYETCFIWCFEANRVCTASEWNYYGSILYMKSGYTVTGAICRNALLLS